MNPRSSATRDVTRKNTKSKKSATELYRRVCPRTCDIINALGQETWATADMLFTMSKILTDLELSHMVEFPQIYPDEGMLNLEWDGELLTLGMSVGRKENLARVCQPAEAEINTENTPGFLSPRFFPSAGRPASFTARGSASD